MGRLAFVLLLPTVLALMVSPQPGEADTGGVEFVGALENPFAARGPDQSGLPLGVFGDRFYAAVQTAIGEPFSVASWDITTEIPTPVAVAPEQTPGFAGIGTGRTSLDTTRNRLTLGFSAETNWILQYDPDTLEAVRTVRLESMLPGFALHGLTYHEEADRFYLLGDFSGSPATSAAIKSFVNPAAPIPSVVAIDAETFSVQWIHQLPECNSLLFSSKYGSLLGLSAARDVLYAFCTGGNLRAAPTGQAALVRVFIEPTATAADAAGFRREVFPISGAYSGDNSTLTGVVGFDRVRERMVVQSRSNSTPGGWVFDGRSGSWVGFVAAPDSTNAEIGIDEESGRYYMGGNFNHTSGYLNVTDVGATPPPQGRLFDRHWIWGPMFPDPDSDRVFTSVTLIEGDPPQAVLGEPAFEGHDGEPLSPFVVLRDTTPTIKPLPPLDLDEFTVDLPDDRVRQDFTGAAEGFGARYLLVGGAEGITARTSSLVGQPTHELGLGTGDRGVVLAAVPRLDLRQAGVGATGAAATVDEATVGDAEDTTRDLGQDEDADVFGFRDGMATCLDGNGGKVDSTEESELGSARVVCDLEALTGEVAARANEGLSGGNVAVGGATFDTRTYHDPERGVVTETTATATGLRLGPEDGPNVLIERVVTVAETVANGRPGTTNATWERRIEGVSSDNGEVPGGCHTVMVAGEDASTSGDCDVLADAINRIAPKELEVTFPLPSLEATPKGAYAAVEEREIDFLDARTLNNDQSQAIPAMQVEVRNDNTEKSRLFIEFAAIRANSTLTRAELPPDFVGGATGGGSGQTGTASTSGDTTGNTGTEGAGTGAPASDQSATGPEFTAPADDAGAPTGNEATPPAVADDAAGDQQVVAAPAGTSTWLVGTRSLGDAATAAAVWLLFAWPLFVGLRRRRLLSTA